MEITEVRIKLMDDPHERLQAFCSITFDKCFVIRDLKIIQGTKGSFVAMPSRKLTDRCPKCHAKNHLRAFFCSQCGAKLDEERALKCDDGRAKLYADIAHPINSACREDIQVRVLEAFETELIRSKDPDYSCSYDDYGEENYATLKHPEEDGYEERRPAAAEQQPQVSQPGEQRASEPVAPTYFESPNNGKRHRIDPAAADAGKQTPHREQESPARETASNSSSSREKKYEDDFGLGL